MKKFNKAQTATEYLIILAVVIIIGLIVVGVLSGIPSLGGGAMKKTSSSYWSTADIGVTTHAVASGSATGGGQGKIVLRNNFAESITIQNVSLTDTSTGYKAFNDSSQVASAGQSVTFNLYDLANSGIAGESYSYDVSITYFMPSTGSTSVFTGNGNQVEGVIAQSVVLE